MTRHNLISSTAIITQVEDNIVSDMDGEKVMLSIKNGKYYNLGRTGGEIWAMIRQPVSIESLVTSLTKRYKVERIECEEQLVNFLSLLSNEGLIRIEA